MYKSVNLRNFLMSYHDNCDRVSSYWVKMTIINCFSQIAILSATIADASSIYHRQKFRKIASGYRATLKDESRNFTRWFTQTLDHLNADNSATWQQKYFVNDEFFNKEKRNVAFIMIGGEQDITEDWMTNGEWVENARKFKPILFNLEHRFYGESHPTNDASLENLQYLTIEQALADLAAFIPAMNKEYNLSPDVKWIAFGDSYSASLAAWAKLKYPQLIQGVVSSSAPVLAVLNYPGYYQVVADDLRNVDENCYNAVQQAFTQVDPLLQNEAGQKSLTSMFQLCDPLEDSADNENDLANFYNIIAGHFAEIAQYNKDNRLSTRGTLLGNITLDTVCDIMTNSAETKEINRLATFNALMNKAYGDKCTDYKYSNLLEDLKDSSWAGALGGRQWEFQICNEIGALQTSDGKPQIFGNKFNINFLVQECMDLFGSKFTSSYIESATNRINDLYGGLNINVSNVVFIQGSVDPWRKLGITKLVNSNALAIFIEGTAHCANIYPPKEEDLPLLTEARLQVTKLIQTWLGLK